MVGLLKSLVAYQNIMRRSVSNMKLLERGETMATLKDISNELTKEKRILNELVYYLTADYRAANPEANAAFFEEYPEMKEFEKASK